MQQNTGCLRFIGASNGLQLEGQTSAVPPEPARKTYYQSALD